MTEVIRVTEESTRDEVAAALEARIRRLMAQRARLPRMWQQRAERNQLLVDIDDALDEYNAAR